MSQASSTTATIKILQRHYCYDDGYTLMMTPKAFQVITRVLEAAGKGESQAMSDWTRFQVVVAAFDSARFCAITL